MGRGPWSGYVHGERMNGALPIFVDVVDAISPSHFMLTWKVAISSGARGLVPMVGGQACPGDISFDVNHI